MNKNLNEILVTGEWTGFFLESHHNRRGWMHLFLKFQPADEGTGGVAGEGTDYVGPWNLAGSYRTSDLGVEWVKRYVKKHMVRYDGTAGDHGIIGTWTISGLKTGKFHIWPSSWGDLDEAYLEEEIRASQPSRRVPGIIADGVMEPAFPDDSV